MATTAEPAMAMESHSIEPIPEADKTSKPIDQFWIWSGANIAVTNWLIGTLGIVFGLGFWATALTFIVGNLVGSALFAAVAVMGARTGVGQMVLSRAPFGRRGAYLIAIIQLLMCIGWIGVNSVFSVQAALQLLELAGVPDTTLTKLVVVFLIYAIQIVIGAFGYYAITKFERVGVPLTMALMAVMTILVLASGRLNLAYQGRLAGLEQFGTMAAIFAAVGIGWGISWTTWASDYSRYVPRSVPPRSVFWANYFGMLITTVWLGVLGAMTATITPEKPGDLVVTISQLFGWFSIPAFFIVIYGVTSTNILNVHSGALAALTADIRVSRPLAALVSGVLGALITFYSLFLSDIAQTMDLWMLTLLVWITPWLAIVLVDFYLLRKGEVDVDGLYASPERSPYGDVVWPAIVSWALGFGLSYLWANTPKFTGPLAQATGGSDFSWVIAFVVAGGLYYVLRRRQAEAAPAV
jgi:NCS1 nucleoside transporter family